MRMILAAACVTAALMCAGCAMITGTVTGAITGAVDAPAETYRANREGFKQNPVLFSFDAVVIGPIGIVTGPVFGLFKGMSLDIQWVIGQVRYGDVFGSYRPQSIWRPHTLKWKPVPEKKDALAGEGMSDECQCISCDGHCAASRKSAKNLAGGSGGMKDCPGGLCPWPPN